MVTRGAQAAGGGAVTDLRHAPLWGMARTVVHEFPELRMSSVDLDPNDPSMEPLAAELAAADGEDQVVYRNKTRYAARLAPHVLPMPSHAELKLSDTASYLVTGGLGGIGLQVATWLVQHGAKHLVLINRHATRPHPMLDALFEMGARVEVAAVDVSDGDQLASLFAHLSASAYPVRGIFHCAGIYTPKLMLNLQRRDLQEEAAAKMKGSWNLHTLAQGLQLDHFVLFSSTSALLAAPGQASYGASNAFLDALASYRRAAHQPAVSINWGPWREVGMAQRGQVSRSAMQGFGEGMATAQALSLMARAMTGTLPTVAAMSFNARQYRQYFPSVSRTKLFANLMDATPATDVRRGQFRDTLLSLTPAQARTQLENHLRDTAARVLTLPPQSIHRDRPLQELGLDSLMGVELRSRLEDSLGLDLPATLVLTFPTLRGLTSRLAEQMKVARHHTDGDGDGDGDGDSAPQPQQSSGQVMFDTLDTLGKDSQDELTQLLDAELAKSRETLGGLR